jgi:tetratricopeptide (TPR) repeat protein
VSEALDHEIRTLQSIFWSERDPDGLAFAPLADAYLRRGEIRAALDLLTEGASRHPEYATGHVVASRLYYGQGMHGEAELAARRVLQLDDENLVGLSILASVLQERGEVAEARSLKEQLAAIDPDSAEARAALAEPSEETSPHLAEALESLGLSEEDEGGWGLETLELAAVEVEAHDEPVETMELPALAPEADGEPPTDVFDLSALAPDREYGDAEVDAEIVDLALLAPEPADVEVMDLAALAPDAESPTDDVMDFADLAPEPPDAEVMDLAALAPDAEPPAEDVMDPADLAPKPAAEGADEVMDLAALAPDAEPPAEDVMDLADLAPEPAAEGADEVMDLAALAPDAEPPADVVDLAVLAPEESDPEPDVAVRSASPPEPAEPRHVAKPEEEPRMDRSEPVYTRTLAELYVKQGFVAKALGVYRHLLRGQPDASDLRERIEALESGSAEIGSAAASSRATPPPLPTPTEEPFGAAGAEIDAGADAHDEAVETLARDLAGSGDTGHDVDTPFAWTNEEHGAADAATDGGPGIGDYFDNLLAWEERGES